MGSFYSFGNISTYMTSYMRMHGSPNITYEDFVVVQSTWGMTQGTVMPLSGFLIAFIGEKAAMVSGAFIFRYENHVDEIDRRSGTGQDYSVAHESDAQGLLQMHCWKGMLGSSMQGQPAGQDSVL